MGDTDSTAPAVSGFFDEDVVASRRSERLLGYTTIFESYFCKRHNKYKLPLVLSGRQEIFVGVSKIQGFSASGKAAAHAQSSSAVDATSRAASSFGWSCSLSLSRSTFSLSQTPMLSPHRRAPQDTGDEKQRIFHVPLQYDILVREGAKYFRHSMHLLCDAAEEICKMDQF